MDYSLSRCLLGHILDVRPLPLSRRTRPSTTPSVADLNHQNVCTAEDANSTLSGRCEPSGGRSRAISRRRLGFAHTKIAPVAQRLPSGRVLVPAWGAVAQGSARGLGALYVLLQRLVSLGGLASISAPWHSRLLPLLRLGSSWTSSAARSHRFFPEASSRRFDEPFFAVVFGGVGSRLLPLLRLLAPPTASRRFPYILSQVPNS